MSVSTETYVPLAKRLLQHNPRVSYSPIIETFEGQKRRLREINGEDLYVKTFGVDLRTGHLGDRQEAKYEDACFDNITSIRRKKSAIDIVCFGPHLIDSVLPVCFTKKSIPDAIELRAEQNNTWLLTTLFEFKSGNVKPIRKVKGFSALLDDLTSNTSYLPGVLKEVFPWAADELPERVVVPSKSKVSVIFVTPDIREPEAIKELPRVTHLYVPAM